MPNKVGEHGYSLPVMMYEKDIDILDEFIVKTGILERPIMEKSQTDATYRKILVRARKEGLSQLIRFADSFIQRQVGARADIKEDGHECSK